MQFMQFKKYIVYLPYIVFVISLLSVLISLFFSEILKFTPCVLCWWQRIFMYPIAIISAVNIMRKHSDIQYYILPFSIIGLCIAIYQNLLVWHILPERIAPCTAGVSCIDQPIVLFGFLTIPLGSMIAFAGITLSMLLYAWFQKDTVKNPVRENSQTGNNSKTIKRNTKK